jgi:hypothetical protein
MGCSAFSVCPTAQRQCRQVEGPAGGIGGHDLPQLAQGRLQLKQLGAHEPHVAPPAALRLPKPFPDGAPCLQQTIDKFTLRQPSKLGVRFFISFEIEGLG